MNRQPLRTLSVLALPLFVIPLGCADDPIDTAYESTESGDESDSLDAGEEPDAGDAEGPTVEIMLDGDPLPPPPVLSVSELHLQAEADAPLGISVVKFYLDDQLISSDEVEPYEANVIVPDASWNGDRLLTARAYDSSGNMAERSLALLVALPESGTVEWEYIGPAGGQRWVLVGAEDSALVFSPGEMLRISSEGTLLSTYEFTYDVSAVTATNDGGVMAVGTSGGTLVIQRFTNEGVPLYLDLIEEFGDPEMSITEVALSEDDHLVISSVHPHYAGDTARISSVALADEVALEWHRYLLHGGIATDNTRATHVAVSPSGAIYMTPTFDASGSDVVVQLRRIESNGSDGSIADDLVNYRSSYDDVVATEHGVFVAARLTDLAAIWHFDADGEPNALYYLEANKTLMLEPVDDELVYVSSMPNHSMKLGRISMNGEERWSTHLDGQDTIHDVALASLGHMYVVSELESVAWRLRRIHP
jgi:hypothetical protein